MRVVAARPAYRAVRIRLALRAKEDTVEVSPDAGGPVVG
jgi:hypothetical protein